MSCVGRHIAVECRKKDDGGQNMGKEDRDWYRNKGRRHPAGCNCADCTERRLYGHRREGGERPIGDREQGSPRSALLFLVLVLVVAAVVIVPLIMFGSSNGGKATSGQLLSSTPTLSKTPSPTPTSTTAISTPVTTLKNKSELQKFLNDNFAMLNTSIGMTKFTFDIVENDSINLRYDYWIRVVYDITFFHDLLVSNSISTEMNHIVAGELQAHMEKLAVAVIDKMPSKKLTGSYTNMKDTLGWGGVHQYCAWDNYYNSNPNVLISSNPYEDSVLCGFVWAYGQFHETPWYNNLLR